jgi:MerR family transcriptional regulator/heat shock protein HspR
MRAMILEEIEIDLAEHRLELDEPRYTISVAARLVELHPQTLRRYEEQGLVSPARISGRRLYSQRDVQLVRRIAQMMDSLGVNLAAVEVILRMSEQISRLQTEIADLEARLAALPSARARSGTGR